MNEHFIEQLENVGLLRNGIVNTDTIARTRISTLIDIAEESSAITSAENLKREESVFALTASLSLAGDRVSCSSLNCRMRRVQELAQFALLYSDRIYVKNLLMDYAPNAIRRYKLSDTGFRKFLTQDLTIMAELGPLVSKGMIVPFTPPLDYCPCCLVKRYLGSESDNRFQETYEHLKAEFLDRVSYTLRWAGRKYEMDINGPVSLMEHGSSGFEYDQTPHELLSFPATLKRSRGPNGVLLSRDEIVALGLHEREANSVIESIAFELTTAQTLGTSFLTERPLHIELLNALNQDPEMERRNQIAERYLTSLVPFLSGVKLKDLMRLREEEKEAFVLYRQSLNEAIVEYRSRHATFDEKNARELYSDVIAPRLAGLDQKVTAAKRTLVKETVYEAAAWIGAISFGIYTGFIPADLVAAAKLLGMGKVAAEFLKSIMARSNVTDPIRSEDMYFLWRVRQLSSPKAEAKFSSHLPGNRPKRVRAHS